MVEEFKTFQLEDVITPAVHRDSLSRVGAIEYRIGVVDSKFRSSEEKGLALATDTS
jgi:hypothetical protein